MAAIFSKNCILSSNIDYYCLVCAEQIATEENTLAHILDLQHKGNLNSCGYLEKYKDDFIRKIHGVYFCEPCALTFPTATKVDLHVQDTGHIINTTACFKQHIKRVNNEITVFDKYLISEDAWNGFIEDTCVICSTEFEDSASHKALRSHVLNLIKSHVAADHVTKSVYRKIDAKSNQCLTCNIIFGKDPSDHYKNSNHKDAYKFLKQNNIPSENRNDNNAPSNYSKSKLSESVDRYQNNFNIDLINEIAVCKKCAKNIDFNTDAIERHIEEHKNTLKKKSQGNIEPLASGNKTNGTDGKTLYTTPVSLEAGKKFAGHLTTSGKKLKEFASQHGLTHNRADNSFYCKICSRRVPATLKELEKHVAGSSHTRNKEQPSVNPVAMKAPVKVPVFENITSYEIVEAARGEIINIINDKYWINAFGFYLIAKFNMKIICHGCNIDLLEENLLDHMISDTHRESVTRCLLITSLEDEFIREIKLDVYHCGYCNKLEHDWYDVLEHIERVEHKKVKLEALQNLRNHLVNPSQRVTNTDIQRMLSIFQKHGRL